MSGEPRAVWGALDVLLSTAPRGGWPLVAPGGHLSMREMDCFRRKPSVIRPQPTRLLGLDEVTKVRTFAV